MGCKAILYFGHLSYNNPKKVLLQTLPRRQDDSRASRWACRSTCKSHRMVTATCSRGVLVWTSAWLSSEGATPDAPYRRSCLTGVLLTELPSSEQSGARAFLGPVVSYEDYGVRLNNGAVKKQQCHRYGDNEVVQDPSHCDQTTLPSVGKYSRVSQICSYEWCLSRAG